MFKLVVTIVLVAGSIAWTNAQSHAQSQKDLEARRIAVASAQGSKGPAMAMDHSHDFEATPDGGFIAMQRATEDTERVAQIRRHIEDIARLFASGDFRLPPGSDQAQEVPGARVMKQALSNIRFTAQPIPRGSELVISSADSKAIAAIHEFLEFHRLEHQAHQPAKD